MKSENIKNDFAPKRIGEEDARRSLETQSIYEHFTEAANKLKTCLETCLKKVFELDEYLSFLKNENPQKWIYEKFIEIHEIKFPGLSTEKIIELRLLDIEADEALAAYEIFQSALTRVQTNNFFYPLRKLWSEEENHFEQNGDFWETCDNHYSRFTHTPEQNKILGIFENICEQLNELAELNILRPQHGQMELNALADYIEIAKARSAPFIVDRYLFSQHRLSPYKTKGETLKTNIFTAAELFH